MKRRRGIEIWLAVLFTLAMLAVGGGVLYFVVTRPVHGDAASVPSAPASAPSAGDARSVEEARRLARSLLVDENLPGLSAAVAREGVIVWAEGFGWADVEQHRPVTPETRFRIGSVSIPLTSAAVGLLYERGRIDFDAPVQNYAPEFQQKEWPVTVRQVMGHVAGIYKGRGGRQTAPIGHCTSLADAVHIFSGDPLAFRPGTEYRYSPFDWVLVSAAVEHVANEPFFTFMQREVLAPIGMARTTPDLGGDVEGRTTFYFPRMGEDTKLGIQETSSADYSCYFGTGAYLSTPSDLVRFGSAMLKPGLLKPATIAMLQTPLQLESGASTGYGLGWNVESVSVNGKAIRAAGHKGSSMGGTTSFMTLPDVGLSIAVVANESYAKGVAPYAAKLADLFANRRGAGL